MTPPHQAPAGLGFGQYQAAVGFGFLPVSAEGVLRDLGGIVGALEPEFIRRVGAGARVARRYRDPSGAVVSFGADHLAIGIDSDGPGVTAGAVLPDDLGGWALGWTTPAQLGAAEGAGEGTLLPILFLPTDRRDLRPVPAAADALAAAREGGLPEAVGRLRLTALFRDDVATRTMADNAAREERDRWEPMRPGAVAHEFQVCGEILDSELRTTVATGRRFRMLRLRIAEGMVLHACAPERPGGPDYAPGRLIGGPALLTGGFALDGEPAGIIGDRGWLAALDAGPAPAIGVAGTAAVVRADVSDCLGVSLHDTGEILAALLDGWDHHPWRVDEDVVLHGDRVEERAAIGREDEEGIGLAIGFPQCHWGGYVNGARAGDRTRLRLAGTDVLIVSGDDAPDIAHLDLAALRESAAAGLRAALAGYAEREAGDAAARGRLTDADFAAAGVTVLEEDALPAAQPDDELAEGADPALPYGTRVPLCARITEVRQIGTALAADIVERRDLSEYDGCRVEAVIDLDGAETTLYLPGDVAAVPVGGLVIGWATVCGHSGHLADVIDAHARDGFPRIPIRPFRTGFDDPEAAAGAILAAAGPEADPVRAMFLTCRGPRTAPEALTAAARAAGLDGEVARDGVWRLRPGPDGAPVLPLDEAMRVALTAALGTGSDDPAGGQPETVDLDRVRALLRALAGAAVG